MQRSTPGILLAALSAVLLAACSHGSSTSTPPPSNNLAPTANAGTNQTVNTGVTVTLNGGGSSDPDGTVAGFSWSQTGGIPTVTLSSNTATQPTFAAPSVTAVTTLTFSLTVTDNLGANSGVSTVTVTINPVGGNVIGRVRFTRIPVTSNGLNYAGGQLQPARGVIVRAVAAGNPQNVLATATTGTDGAYSMSITGNTDYQVVVVAQMLRDASQPLPRWNFRAMDHDAVSPTPYTYTNGQTHNSGAGATVNLDIPSGIDTGGNVTGTRASAPFAILDTVYQATQLVLSAAPATNFPALILDWATDNPGGETYFDGSAEQLIVLSAEVTEDTDEFDQHVIAHEFGHYIEFNFSRADNIGGAHGLGDKLDIRVAFGEGFGYAFGAMVLGDPLSHDTFVDSACPNDSCSSTFNVETNPATLPAQAQPAGNFGCWCSESSVWSILWDVYDNNADGNDNVALGFMPIWNVLVNEERTTHAFTSVFSFMSALRAANPASVAAIDALLSAQNITTTSFDAYGTGETHVPAPVAAAAALPLYTNISVGGAPVILRTVDDAGRYNTLGNHRFLRFTLASARTITISASSSNTNTADPDFYVYRDGQLVMLGLDPPPQPETETITNAAAGDYLIDVYDCANGCSDEEGVPGDYDITVTVN